MSLRLGCDGQCCPSRIATTQWFAIPQAGTVTITNNCPPPPNRWFVLPACPSAPLDGCGQAAARPTVRSSWVDSCATAQLVAGRLRGVKDIDYYRRQLVALR
jgi:hypothetical protein